jgi:hypothetical protein
MNELFFLDEGYEVMTEERRAHPTIEDKFSFFSYSPNGYNNRKNEIGFISVFVAIQDADEVWKICQYFADDTNIRVSITTKKQRIE